ncbi:MAG: hypothetical protein HYV35_07290 [Lentisphaerae bacterium]|nr:hypothetical protein [Lentisphaerota bacterium]
MGLFSNKAESVEQAIERLFKEQRVAEIETELRKFDPEKLRGKEKDTWYFYWGVAAFRRGDRPEAFRRLDKAHRECPESDQIAFSLGQEYEAKADPQKMVSLFKACSFPKISAQYVLAASRYCYLWDLLEDGQRLLDPIRAAYFQLGIADDHFVYVRGLPFFSQTWSYLLCFCALRNDFTVIEDFTNQARAKLSDYDFDHLASTLRCYQAHSFQEKIAELERHLQNADQRFPQGYSRTQLACLRALTLADPAQAEECLAEVAFADNDFKWLADVILIHRARLAEKTGETEREAALVAEFFSRQPLLFEPDHAVNFAFLDYQEKLKRKYRELKKAQAGT